MDEYNRYATHLHNEEVRVVDVKTDRVEQVLHCLILGQLAVDEVFVFAADLHLHVMWQRSVVRK
jgi:hypothetical protein